MDDTKQTDSWKANDHCSKSSEVGKDRKKSYRYLKVMQLLLVPTKEKRRLQPDTVHVLQ
jgi:hypothetical protein